MEHRLFCTVCALLFATVPQSVVSIRIEIATNGGKNCFECFNFKPIICESLECIADNHDSLYNQSVEIVITSQVLYLDGPMEIVGYSNISITGESSAVIYCKESDAGLAFIRVRNLTLQFITIKKCGSPRETTTLSFEGLMLSNVAVYILNCTTVLVRNISIINSNGTGMSLYDTNGIVKIMDSVFSNNPENAKNLRDGGGGLHIEFTLCTPGISPPCPSGHGRRNKNSFYNITNNNFLYNSAVTTKSTYISPSPNQEVPRLGKGGGFYLSVAADAANNSFYFEKCILQENMATRGGGAMQVEFLDYVRNNNVTLRNMVFIKNKCIDRDTSTGGGLVLNAIFYTKTKHHLNNSFLCFQCKFEKNIASIGGGTAIYASKNSNNAMVTSILFNSSNWTENTATTGAALFSTPALWDSDRVGFLPTVEFSNCSFSFNSGTQRLLRRDSEGLNVSSLGYGTIFSLEVPVIFLKNMTFQHNQVSALYLINCIVEVKKSCHVTFYNNTAENGGAISLYESSAIQTWNNSVLIFSKNHAKLKGGAIYMSFHAALQPRYRSCFIQNGEEIFSKTNATFIFEGNTAGNGGTSIFATTFRMCEVMCENRTAPDSKTMLECVGNFQFVDNNSLSLATIPEKFQLKTKSPVSIVPGIEFYIPLSSVDETNEIVNVSYSANVLPYNSNVQIDQAFSHVSNNTIRLLGPRNDSTILELRVLDVALEFDVILADCPPGYIYSDKICQSASSHFLGLVPCDDNVCLKQGFWMGYCRKNQPKLCTSTCPPGYCTYQGMNPDAEVHHLPIKHGELEKAVCGLHREGRLCSKCSNGWSAYFHSNTHTCGPSNLCQFGWIFYILSEIFPLTLLFLLVVFFNVSFTDGKMNSVIFYIQILDALALNGNGTIKFGNVVNWFHEIIMLLYRPLNLDFFIHKRLAFCLWKDGSIIDMIMMKYATILYALILVVSAIHIAKVRYVAKPLFTKFQTHTSILIHGLTTFFVLCYSQTTRTTFHILTNFCLYSVNWKCEVRVLYYAGYMNFFGDEHIKYALVALPVLIVIVIIPPLLLLSYPTVFKLLRLCKLHESKMTCLLWRMMPIQLLDSFQSSFKDKYRFFAGFYFIYRAMVLGAFAFGRSVLLFYSFIQIMLTILIVLHALLQPYKQRLHNIIDVLLLANLAVINAISLYNYVLKDTVEQYSPKSDINSLGMIQKILMIMPLLCIILSKPILWIKQQRDRRRDYENLPSLRSQSFKD